MIYFAAEPNPFDLAVRVMKRIRRFREAVVSSGRFDAWCLGHDLYYSMVRESGADPRRVRLRGKRGELVQLSVPHFAAIARIVTTITINQLPEGQPAGASADSAMEAASILGRALLAHCRGAKGYLELYDQAALAALLLDSAWAAVLWDPEAGPELSEPDAAGVLRGPDGEVVGIRHEGADKLHILLPLDVAVDVNRNNQDHHWLVATLQENKHDLAAVVERGGRPGAAELAQRIRDASTGMDSGAAGMQWGRLASSGAKTTSEDEDNIRVHHFFHRPSPACPRGRYVRLINDGLVIEDYSDEQGPLNPYGDELPVKALMPEVHLDTAHGHSGLTDLMGLQEAVDAVTSTAVTRNRQSLPKLVAPRGAGLDSRKLDGAYSLVETNSREDAAAVRPLEFTNNSGQDVALGGALVSAMETLSGAGNVLRGNLTGSEASTSGSARAFQQAQSLLANSRFQGKFYAWIAWVETHLIAAHKRFNRTKRALEVLSGESGAAMVHMFSGADLEAIKAIEVLMTGSMRQDPQARIALLQTLAAMGMQLPFEDILVFVDSGKFEDVVGSERAEHLFIKQENEQIMRGEEPAPPAPTERHPNHIKEHAANMFSEAAKGDPRIAQAQEAHIVKHMQAWASMPPVLAAVLKIGPAPMQADIMPGIRGGEPAPADGAPAQGQQPPAPSGGRPPPQAAGQPQTPNMPSLPHGGGSSAGLAQGKLPT